MCVSVRCLFGIVGTEQNNKLGRHFCRNPKVKSAEIKACTIRFNGIPSVLHLCGGQLFLGPSNLTTIIYLHLSIFAFQLRHRFDTEWFLAENERLDRVAMDEIAVFIGLPITGVDMGEKIDSRRWNGTRTKGNCWLGRKYGKITRPKWRLLQVPRNCW